MKLSLDLSALKRTRWYEYGLRFFFGGAITVATGLIAKRYGPVFGGLFLAFPAIFPASATLVEKHETEKKRIFLLWRLAKSAGTAHIQITTGHACYAHR